MSIVKIRKKTLNENRTLVDKVDPKAALLALFDTNTKVMGTMITNPALRKITGNCIEEYHAYKITTIKRLVNCSRQKGVKYTKNYSRIGSFQKSRKLH